MTPGIFVKKAAVLFGIPYFSAIVLHRALVKAGKFGSHGRGRAARDVSRDDAKWLLASAILFHAHAHKGAAITTIPKMLLRSHKSAVEAASRALSSGKVEYSGIFGKAHVTVKMVFPDLALRTILK